MQRRNGFLVIAIEHARIIIPVCCLRFQIFFNTFLADFPGPPLAPPPCTLYTVKCLCNFACFFTEIYSLKHSLILIHLQYIRNYAESLKRAPRDAILFKMPDASCFSNALSCKAALKRFVLLFKAPGSFKKG